MANHSHIRLKTAIQPEDVEKVLAEVNERRFQGRLKLDVLRLDWKDTLRAWVVYAPDTKPTKPSPWEPADEDLAFCFWLTLDGKGIETRHGVHNTWMRWIMYVHEHELAAHFEVQRFDGGDGMIRVLPKELRLPSFYDYATYNYKMPLSANDAVFIQRHFLDKVPEGWR